MTDPVEIGLRAWLDGDLDTLQSLLDPDVRLEWAEPGGLDCVGREQVMRSLHQARGGIQQSPPPRRIERLTDDVVVVSPTTTEGSPNDQPAATRITVKPAKSLGCSNSRPVRPRSAARTRSRMQLFGPSEPVIFQHCNNSSPRIHH